MLSFSAMKILPFLKHFRNVSSGLVLDKKAVTKKKALKTLDLKKVSKKKPRKKKILLKKTSDDIETVWLENLNSENLALYRKTSYGTFRKINLPKLLDRLQQIYPSKLDNVQIAPAKTDSDPEKSSSGEAKPKSGSGHVQGSPYMSKYLITHIMEFPLFKTKIESPFSEFVKQESEDFGEVDALSFPSVTGILSETMSDTSKARLKLWRDGLIAEMGVENFSKYYRDLLKQGNKFHSTMKTYLEVADKSLVKVDPEIEGCWQSLKNVFPELKNVRLVEHTVYHPILSYRGVVDCVASYRGTPCIIEWKKSNKLKTDLSDTYDAPLQLSAYLGALPWNKRITVKKGIVVVVYTDGTPANVFDMPLESCEVYWLEWLRRVQTYWLKKSYLLDEK